VDDILYHPVVSFSHQRLLSQEAEEVIVDEAERIPEDAAINLVFEVSEEQSFDRDKIASLLTQHFLNRRDTEKIRLKTVFRLGWKSLFVGLIFVIAMVVLTKLSTTLLPDSGLVITLRQLFLILGWVALWRPAELLLYEWRPYSRRVRLYERTAAAKIDIKRQA